MTRVKRNGLSILLIGWALGGALAVAQETFTATEQVNSPSAGDRTAPVTISIARFSSNDERQAVMSTFRSQGQDAARQKLAAMPDIGWIEAASTKTPIKYAFALPTGDGRVITIVTAQPIIHLGANLPDAKSTAGHDLAAAFLVLDASGKGHGEFAPAAKMKLQADGSIAVEDYGGSVVWLRDIAKK